MRHHRLISILSLIALSTIGGCCGSRAAEAQTTNAPADRPATSESKATPAKPRRRFRIGPEIDLFRPQSARSRSRFGDAWTSFGGDIGGLEIPQEKALFDIQPQILSSSRSGNHATLLMPEARYRIPTFGSGPIRSFVGFTAGPIIAETRVTSEHLPSRWRGGVVGGIESGIALDDKGLITLGYQWSSRVRGFDFSGARAGMSWRF